jgi:hypothetical protein
MPRKRAKPEFPAVTLMAKVNPPRRFKPYRATQEEMAEMFDVSPRTLREWHQVGLPRETDEKGRPVYPFPAANIWASCYKAKVRASANRKGPRFLTMEEADRWHLERQVDMGETEFALVPMYWDHPMREKMLRLAAVGLQPPPEAEE